MTITGSERFSLLKNLEALGANLTEQQVADAVGISVMDQSEAEAGTATTIRFITAQRIAQAIAALSTGSNTSLTTTAFDGILSGTEDDVQKALDILDDIFGSAVSITGDLTVTGDGEFIDTATDANPGPELVLYRNSASPADNDRLGRLRFDGEDDGSNKVSYAAIEGVLLDTTVSAGIEGRLDFYAMDDGTLSKKMQIHRGLVIGSPTGGQQGTGTVNATAIYDDGVQIKPVEVFRSTGSAITASTAHTFAHGLSAEPDMVTVILQNTSAELNYSTGDRVIITNHFEDQGATSDKNQGISVQIDATNVTVRTAEELIVADKTSTSPTPITVGSWDMYVKAVYFT